MLEFIKKISIESAISSSGAACLVEGIIQCGGTMENVKRFYEVGGIAGIELYYITLKTASMPFYGPKTKR